MKNAFIKVSLRYGLIAGVVCCLALVALYYMDRHPFLIPITFDFRIFIFAVLMFFSLKEIRDYYQDGILYFWQGMLSCFMIVLTSAVLGASFVLAFAKWNGDFISRYVAILSKQLTDHKKELIEQVTQKVYDEQVALLPHTSASGLATDYFLKSILIGLFLAIIFSVILRKQPKTN